MKDCQFCGEYIKEYSYYCNNCNHVQRDKALAYERFLRIQILRYGAIVMALVLPVTTFCCFLGMLEYAAAIILDVGQITLLFLFCFPILSAIISSIPESAIGDVKIPYLLERIKYGQKAMIRNWVIFPSIGFLLVFAQIKLAKNKPSLMDFRTHLKGEKMYSKKSILEEGECAFLTYHVVGNTEGVRLFIGLNHDFYSFDPSVFSSISK